MATPQAPAGAPDSALRAAQVEPLHPPMTGRQKALGIVAAVALVAFPFVFNSPFPQHVMIMIFLYGTMAQSWNIMAGYCGQISLGHAMFFGIGAYSSAFLFTTYQISPWLGMLLGMVFAMAAAAVIGLPTFRLRGHYFAIATLVIGESVQIVVQRWDFIGAASGIWLPIVRENQWANFQFHDSKIPYYFIALSFLAVACLAVRRMERSRLGFYFRAIREEPEAARSLGVNITLYKSLAFMLSAALMAMAGTFYAQYVLVVDPEVVFPLTLSILVLLMAVMGGVGTLWGPLLGAAVLIPLSETTRILLGGTGGAVDLMIYGALIVMICLFKPEGLIGLVRHFLPSSAATKEAGHGDA